MAVNTLHTSELLSRVPLMLNLRPSQVFRVHLIIVPINSFELRITLSMKSACVVYILYIVRGRTCVITPLKIIRDF